MQNQKISFFEETPGQHSATRLIFICGSFYTMLMGAWVFHSSHDYVALIATVGSLSGVFISVKLIQKPMEEKQNPPT